MVAAGLLLSRILEPAEYDIYDRLLTHCGPQRRLDDRLRIIGIDDASLQAFGRWPWPRSRHGELVDKLREGGAAVAMFDIEFDSAVDAADDARFATSMQAFKKVTLAYKLGRHSDIMQEPDDLPLPLFARAAAGIGFINVDQRNFGVSPMLRRACLAARDKTGRLVPSLDLVTFALYTGVSPERIHYGFHRIRVGDVVIPTTGDYEMMIPYFTGSGAVQQQEALFSPLSYARVIGAPLPSSFPSSRATLPPDVRGGLCLIGVAGSDVLGDIHTTPVGEVPGIYVHADILNTLLTQCWLQEMPQPLYLFSIVLLPLLVALRISRMSAWSGLTVALGSMLGYSALTIFAFAHGFWIKAVAPCVGIFLAAGIVFCYQTLRSHNLISLFVTPEIARRMLATGGDTSVIEERVITVLFSDIRGYTTLIEKMFPRDAMELLNEYHTITIDIYERHGGRCVSYYGDAQMVLFGAPLDNKNHAAAAVRAALEAQQALVDMRARWQERARATFEVGIGICTGPAACGFVGSAGHREYTAIGDSTNTAARIQALSQQTQSPVLASEETVKEAGDAIRAEPLEPVMLKGKTEPVMIYRILGVAEKSRVGAGSRALLLGLALLAGGSFTACTGAGNAAPSPLATTQTTSTTTTRVDTSTGGVASGAPASSTVFTGSTTTANTPAATAGNAVVTGSTTSTGATPATGASGATTSSAPTPLALASEQPRPHSSKPLVPPPERHTFVIPPINPPKPMLSGLPGIASAPSALPIGTSLADNFPLPLYRGIETRKKGETSTDITLPDGKTVKHVVLILTTTDSIDAVKKFYADKIKFESAIDSKGESGQRLVTLTRVAIKGAKPEDNLFESVVIQPDTPGTQIVLSSYVK